MSIIFEQFPDNPGNNVDVTNLLNSIRDLYSSTKSDKYQTISTLRKLSKLDTAESRKLNDVNRFKDKSDMIKSNLETYVGTYKGDIESFITTLDKNGVEQSSLLNRYRSHIDYLRDNGKISNKNYNEAQLYFNFINDYITYMEGKKVELKDGRFADLNERYNGNEQVVNDWMDKIGDLYTTLLDVVSLYKTRRDEFRNIQRDNGYYVENSNGLLDRYNTVIGNYNSMVSDLNNLIGNGPELLESEIVVINAEIDALQTEINSIQVEIDTYDAQLAPLYVERDGYQAEKLVIYNQWLAAKAAILEPIAEKQNQIVELTGNAQLGTGIASFKSIFIDEEGNIYFTYWRLKELLFTRDGAPLDNAWNIANGGPYDSVGRAFTSEEQTEYDALVLQFESRIGTLEVFTYETVNTAIHDKYNELQSPIDALNVEIADLQAIVTQYTLNDELDRLPNENGDVYMDLMDIPSNLFDAIYVEITGIEELRAPLLVTKDEKISQVDSKNSLIVTKQALIDDIENSEANLIKVTDALTVVTTDKTALDVEMTEYQTKFNESLTYYADILSDLADNHNQIMGSIDSVKNEMDFSMFQQIKNMNKNRWIEWKISEILYSQSYLDYSTFNVMNSSKDWDYNSNIARDNFDTINDSIFVKNSQESDLYFNLASSASSLYGGLNSVEFQTNLVIAKNQEYDLRIQLADQLNYNTEKGASVNLTINEIGTLLTQFVNINPITDDFNSVYGYVMSELTNKYNTLDGYRNEFYLGERSSQHLLYRVERHVGLCESLKSQMESIFIDLDNILAQYRSNRTGLINQLPGNSGSDVLGDWSKLSSLEMHGGQYTSSWMAIRSNNDIYGTKRMDAEYVFRSAELDEYLPFY